MWRLKHDDMQKRAVYLFNTKMRSEYRWRWQRQHEKKNDLLLELLADLKWVCSKSNVFTIESVIFLCRHAGDRTTSFFHHFNDVIADILQDLC